MNHTMITNLKAFIYNFLNQESRFTKKYRLKTQIENWLKERNEEYKNLNNDFHEAQVNSIKM